FCSTPIVSLPCRLVKHATPQPAQVSPDASKGRMQMRINVEIDDALMAEAQKACGHASKKRTVEQALRLMIRLAQQRDIDVAFGKYRWRGNLARSRKARGIFSSARPHRNIR